VSRVFIGLGSNLNQPVKQIKKAKLAINRLDGVEGIAFSSIYKSRPMGPQDQPDYFNAVMEVAVTIEPLALLDRLQAIEKDQGRVRQDARWGARSLDLDILLYGGKIIENDRLVVPHYGISDRPFVLYPLQEISPSIDIPRLGSLADLIRKCSPDGLLKLGS